MKTSYHRLTVLESNCKLVLAHQADLARRTILIVMPARLFFSVVKTAAVGVDGYACVDETLDPTIPNVYTAAYYE